MNTKWLLRVIVLIGIGIVFTGNVNAELIEEKRIDKWCTKYDYKDCALVKTIAWHETNFNAKGWNPEQSGSYGAMQVQCSTAKMVGLKYGCDQLFDPQVNIRFGILYLKWLEKNRVINSVEDLFAAYNAGSPIVCKNKNYNEHGKLLCYPGEYINHNYLYGPRGVMREYKHRNKQRIERQLAPLK